MICKKLPYYFDAYVLKNILHEKQVTGNNKRKNRYKFVCKSKGQVMNRVKSVWKQDIVMKANEGIRHDTSVNTVVIGAGMAGILTAYLLQKKGIEAIVLEASRIGSGQTQNTTAKITSQHGLIYSKMTKMVNKKRAAGYALANEEAIDRYEQIIRAENIDCEFQRLPAVLYSTDERNTRKLKKEAEAARDLGIDAGYWNYKDKNSEMTEVPFANMQIKGAVCFKRQAQFHPLKFLKAISQQLTIYENTPVFSVKGHTVITGGRKIEADHIVFATHYPFINVPGFYFLREHRERSYVLALRGKGTQRNADTSKQLQTPLSSMYYSIDKGGLSLRSRGELLLLGGGNHRTGKKTSCKNEKVGYTFLKRMREKYFPETEIVAAWSAQDCMPHDEIPFIGKYSVFRPYWYVATGFKKWGMTTSMIAAEIISDDIKRKMTMDTAREAFPGNAYDTEKSISRFAFVFSPQRFLLRASFVNLLADIWENSVGLLKGIFAPQNRRCPHMGCRLEWNDEDKSWDCPCHGSRFTNEGELIDNPAQTNL